MKIIFYIFRVGEALNETAFGNGLIARGKHYLIFGHKNVENYTMKARERILQSKIMQPGMVFLTDNVDEVNFSDSYFEVSIGYILGHIIFTFAHIITLF